MDATHALETANLIWGLDAKLLAIIIVSIAYLIIFTEKVHRGIAGCGGNDYFGSSYSKTGFGGS